MHSASRLIKAMMLVWLDAEVQLVKLEPCSSDEYRP